MSLFNRFAVNITDPEVIAGIKEASIDLDLSKMVENDKIFNSKFEVGGRLFYEIQVIGPGFLSFITNGFLDKKDYIEPKIEQNQDFLLKIIYSGVAFSVFIVCSLIFCFSKTK